MRLFENREDMNKFSLILITVVCVFISRPAPAAYPEHEVGLDFSSVSGFGLSYQFKPDVYYAVKITGVAFSFGTDLPQNGEIYADIGLEIQRNLFKKPGRRLFAYLGGSYGYIENRFTSKQIIHEKVLVIEHIDFNHIYNAGVGVGWEAEINRRFVLSLSAGVQYQISDNTAPKGFAEYLDYSPKGRYAWTPSVSAGFKIILP